MPSVVHTAGGKGESGALNCAHLLHGREHLGVAVNDDSNRENEAKECVEDEIAVVVPRSLLPSQRAGGLDSLWAVGTPAEQRSHRPEQTEYPDKEQPHDAPPHAQLQTSSWLTDHVIALIGQQGQRAQRHQT